MALLNRIQVKEITTQLLVRGVWNNSQYGINVKKHGVVSTYYMVAAVQKLDEENISSCPQNARMMKTNLRIQVTTWAVVEPKAK